MEDYTIQNLDKVERSAGGQIRKFSSVQDENSSEAFLKRLRQEGRLTPLSESDASSTSSSPIEYDMHCLPSVKTPSPDEVLTQMIVQSGAKSYSEVVNFCMSTGIPISRMLRLDLMRQLSQSMDTD
ncbi:hypothetical protein ACA910_003308 [Epithemia clementina (nom. ined.)]